MEFKTILIIILIGYMVFWYINPDRGRDLLGDGVDKVKGLLGKNDSACAQNYDPVCGLNVTYDNLCLAEKDGILNVTMGICS